MRFLPRIVSVGTIVLALAGLLSMWSFSQTQAKLASAPPPGPPIPPPDKPFASSVAATGLLEALSENVSIGVPVQSVVQEVFVAVNDPVKRGTPLFRLDDRELLSSRVGATAQVAVARSQVAIEEASLAKLGSQLKRLEAAGVPAITVEELENRRNDLIVSKARIEAARAQVLAAEAEQKRLNLLIERLTVASPRDGTVLQVNIRAGEFAASSPKSPAVVVGETNRLQVRADVDEQNATRVRPGQRAVAFLKGDRSVSIPLEFVRIEPYVIPKVSLTGASTERVDTRVLQVIFSLRRPDEPPLYVGQQVDVFIEAPGPTVSP
jgi:multidrug efflux pump subunit AcrA (membrane-fusion protein)